LLTYFALGAVTIIRSETWGDDWAEYVAHSRNLVAGDAYADTGYIFNPDNADIGPPSYPPGLPVLLAPLIATLGIDFMAMKLYCFLFVVLSVPLMLGALSREFGQRVACAAVLLFAVHDQVWALRQEIGSESPYLFFSMLAIYWMSRDRASQAATSLQIASGNRLSINWRVAGSGYRRLRLGATQVTWLAAGLLLVAGLFDLAAIRITGYSHNLFQFAQGPNDATGGSKHPGLLAEL
jgi:4-amino-4-deoxy-L-arabinose transferase-like glycosyltransferase